MKKLLDRLQEDSRILITHLERAGLEIDDTTSCVTTIDNYGRDWQIEVDAADLTLNINQEEIYLPFKQMDLDPYLKEIAPDLDDTAIPKIQKAYDNLVVTVNKLNIAFIKQIEG